MEFIDIQAQYMHLKKEIDPAVLDVMASGQFIMGNAVTEFEQEFARYLNVKHVVSCANGTDALQLLYMAWGIGKGDAVFVPDITFIATHEPACLLGAEAVFCDIDPVSWNLCPKALEERIIAVQKEGRLTPRCIVGVDFLGNPCDWDALAELADKYGLLLLEDSAQGSSGFYKGKACGSFGHAAATSFFPTKPLGCFGDGGAIMTNDSELAEVLRSLRVHGKGTSKYDNIRIGVNSRLDTIQAAILSVKLTHLERENALRQNIADTYTKALFPYCLTPVIEPCSKSAFAQYTIQLKDTAQRDMLMDALKQNGIPCLVYYPAAQHQLPIFKETVWAKNVKFPHSVNYVERSLSLPFSPYITPEDQQKVIAVLLEALA